MKKIISWVLLLAVILGYTENAYANKYIPKDKVEGTDYYLDEYYEDIYENYRNVMEDFVWEYLKNDKKSIYVGFINETQDIHSLIKETGKYIDEELDEKKYMEILANLMATMDVGVSEVMYHQAEADTLKQTDDYILDAIDIVTEAIGMDLEKLNTDIGHELEYIMDSIDINKSIIEFNINNINDLKYYNYLMEKYDLYHEFLDLIINNAETEELKRAAYTLDYFAGQALFANFTYFDEVTRNFEENIGEDVFFNKIVMKMLEEPEIVTDSIENQEALKLLGNIYEKISLGEFVFKIGIFSGDMIFGTSNMYNRYNEIYVMKEIRDILIRGIEEEDKKITGIEQYDSIEKVINYLKYMLYVNSRGEYCVYNLVVSDGQLMSLINMGNVDDYNRLIKQVQSINTSLEIQIDNIVPDLENYKKEEIITEHEEYEEQSLYKKNEIVESNKEEVNQIKYYDSLDKHMELLYDALISCEWEKANDIVETFKKRDKKVIAVYVTPLKEIFLVVEYHPDVYSWQVYLGEFTEGKKTGSGVMLSRREIGLVSNGIYIGQWNNDMPNGLGILTDSICDMEIIFEGNFIDGKLDSIIKVYKLDSSKIYMDWENISPIYSINYSLDYVDIIFDEGVPPEQVSKDVIEQYVIISELTEYELDNNIIEDSRCYILSVGAKPPANGYRGMISYVYGLSSAFGSDKSEYGVDCYVNADFSVSYDQ